MNSRKIFIIFIFVILVVYGLYFLSRLFGLLISGGFAGKADRITYGFSPGMLV